MAQARPFHCRQSFDNLDTDTYAQPFQGPQFGSCAIRAAPLPSSGTQCFQQDNSMAQSLLQRHYGSENQFSATQQWQRQQTYHQEYKPAIDARSGYCSSDAPYPYNDGWGQSAMFGHGFGPNSGLNMSPHAVSASDGMSYTNSDFVYLGGVAQELVGTASFQHGGASFDALGMPRGTIVDGQDKETDSSLSPVSYTSEVPGCQVSPFTPATTVDTSSDGSHYDRCGAPYRAIKASSPKATTQVVREVSTVGYPGQRRHGLSVNTFTPTPAGTSNRCNGLPTPCEDSSHYKPGYTNSQQSSPAVTPWDLPAPSYCQAVVPVRSQVHQAASAPFNGLPMAYSNNSLRNDRDAWSDPRANVSALHRFQGRFQVPRAVDEQAQRKADDEILLDGKRNGLTYKEIRKRMQAKPAESTLRGRYRSLTKARKDRVRKPVWRTFDIQLLKQYVLQELDRIDANHHQSLGCSQRLAKVQWKKVADFIYTNGGSYHFGNSTCKRKWTELNPGP